MLRPIPSNNISIVKEIFLTLLMGILCFAGFSQDNLPHLQNNQLIVDGKPFLMIAGELHNSSASSADYMESV